MMRVVNADKTVEINNSRDLAVYHAQQRVQYVQSNTRFRKSHISHAFPDWVNAFTSAGTLGTTTLSTTAGKRREAEHAVFCTFITDRFSPYGQRIYPQGEPKILLPLLISAWETFNNTPEFASSLPMKKLLVAATHQIAQIPHEFDVLRKLIGHLNDLLDVIPEPIQAKEQFLSNMIKSRVNSWMIHYQHKQLNATHTKFFDRLGPLGKAAIAANPTLPQDVLEQYALDENEGVRWVAFHNPQITERLRTLITVSTSNIPDSKHAAFRQAVSLNS